MIDYDQLTPRYRESLIYGMHSFPKYDVKILMNALNATISYIACFNRSSFIDGHQEIPLNYHSILFGISGGGKTSSLWLYLDLIKEIRELWKTQIETNIDKEKLKIATKGNSKTKKTPTYIAEIGTPQGFFWDRYLFSLSGSGCSFSVEDEFVNYFSGERSSGVEKLIKDSYDTGKTLPPSTKSFSGEELNGIPHVSLMLSATSDLVDNEKLIGKFKAFLGDGFARRNFCSFVEHKKYKRISFEKKEHHRRTAESKRERVKGFFEEVNLEGKVTMKETKELVAYMHELQEKNGEKADKMIENKVDSFTVASVQGSVWKIKKLAGAIALFEHPERHEITVEDFICAEELESFFFDSFQKFFLVEVDTITDKLYQFIKTREKVTRSQIKRQGFLRGFASFQVTQELKELVSHCEDQGEAFVEEKIKTKGAPKTLYSIEEYKEKETDIKSEKEKDVKINCSYSKEHARGYVYKEFGVDELKKLMTNKTSTNYCLAELKNGYRKKANWTGNKNAIVLDFDNDGGELKIDQFKALFSGYTFLVQPTRSHQIEKHERIVDRYRVIFPIAPLSSEKDYSSIIANLLEAWGLGKEFCDPVATKDSVHYFFPSKHAVEFVQGEKLINWQEYEKQREEKIKRVYAVGYENVEQKKNVIPELAPFFHKYDNLAVGEKVPVKCPQHDDKHPSAFVKRADNGNLFCFCSSGCNLIWEK